MSASKMWHTTQILRSPRAIVMGSYHAALPPVHTQAGAKGKQFFFEKKNQKTFAIISLSPASARTPI
jgi:hypothetical protein